MVYCVGRNERTIISTRQHLLQSSDLTLAGGSPDVLQVSVTLSEAVEGVITLTTGTDETAQSVGVVLAGVATVLVNLADGDLDGGVVVGLDDAVGGAALAGHVAVVDISTWLLIFNFESNLIRSSKS